MEKLKSKVPLSIFPTATTTTKYSQLWDTHSEGKVNEPCLIPTKQPTVGLNLLSSVGRFPRDIPWGCTVATSASWIN